MHRPGVGTFDISPWTLLFMVPQLKMNRIPFICKLESHWQRAKMWLFISKDSWVTSRGSSKIIINNCIAATTHPFKVSVTAHSVVIMSMNTVIYLYENSRIHLWKQSYTPMNTVIYLYENSHICLWIQSYTSIKTAICIYEYSHLPLWKQSYMSMKTVICIGKQLEFSMN